MPSRRADASKKWPMRASGQDGQAPVGPPVLLNLTREGCLAYLLDHRGLRAVRPGGRWKSGNGSAISLGGGLEMRIVFSVILTLVLLGGARTARGDFVVNGGFQSGDFTGWTTNPGNFILAGSGYAGSNGAVLDVTSSLAQTVTTPVGTPLDLTFALAYTGSPGSTFQVSFGGNLLPDPTFTSDGNFTIYKDTVTPGSASNVLQFNFTLPDDGSFFTLSDVSLASRGVSAVAEPGTLALLGIGAALLGGCARRRRPALTQ
jgi:hypothetical protein